MTTNEKVIYKKFLQKYTTDAYKYKYKKLPLKKNNGKWKWEGKDLPRVISLLEFREYVKKYNLCSDNTLVISGKTDPEIEVLPIKKKIHFCSYEDDPINNNVENLNLDKKDFDFVICNQVLEHIPEPSKAFNSIYNHMCNMGILYINVPVNNIPHSQPYHHYTGITSCGLAMLAIRNNFKIIDIGQWGNKEYFFNLFENLKWPDYRKISNYYNDPRYPCICWGLFRKVI